MVISQLVYLFVYLYVAYLSSAPVPQCLRLSSVE